MSASRPNFEKTISALLIGDKTDCVTIASGETSDIYDISEASGTPLILKIYVRPDRQAADYQCNRDLIAYALLLSNTGQTETDLALAINRVGSLHVQQFEQSSKPLIPALYAAHASTLPAWTVMPKLGMFPTQPSSEMLPKISAYLDKLHSTVLPGLKADLRTETPFWPWEKWASEMISLLKSHPMIGGGNFSAEVDFLENLTKHAEPTGATLTHGDIHPQNIYAYEEHPALFDWEELAIAPKERDYGIMLDRMHHAPSVFFDVHSLIESSRFAPKLCHYTIAFYAALARLKRNIVSGQVETLQSFLQQVQLPHQI